MAFELPNLPYAHDALEPHIDARTMEIHHGKHHAGYTSKLNAAIEGTDLAGKDIDTLLRDHSDNGAVRNNGGGFWNHTLFWNSMSPNGGGAPDGGALGVLGGVTALKLRLAGGGTPPAISGTKLATVRGGGAEGEQGGRCQGCRTPHDEPQIDKLRLELQTSV